MVPRNMTNWKALHVTDWSSTFHCSDFLACILLLSFLNHLIVRIIFSLFPLSHHFLFYPPPTLLLPVLSFKSFTVPPASFHSVVKHWLHSHVLLHTLTNPSRQAISGYFTTEQHTNSVTLIDMDTQAGTQALIHTSNIHIAELAHSFFSFASHVNPQPATANRILPH